MSVTLFKKPETDLKSSIQFPVNIALIILLAKKNYRIMSSCKESQSKVWFLYERLVWKRYINALEHLIIAKKTEEVILHSEHCSSNRELARNFNKKRSFKDTQGLFHQHASDPSDYIDRNVNVNWYELHSFVKVISPDLPIVGRPSFTPVIWRDFVIYRPKEIKQPWWLELKCTTSISSFCSCGMQGTTATWL